MKNLSKIIKSMSDKNDYKALQLPNDLKVILIKTQDKVTGASLTVNVGSMRDPKEYHGLAHFLEHMLFISSEKYP